MTSTPEPPENVVHPEVVGSPEFVSPAPADADDIAAALGNLDVGGLGMGGLDMGALLEQAQSMQAGLLEAQARAAEAPVEGAAGGGVVRIEATAGLEFQAVHIRPEAVQGASAADIEMLEDLVLAALRDVVSQANDVSAQALGELGGLGGLGGLLGG